jgi:type II secretory pathway component GspD/PulD (secretin)
LGDALAIETLGAVRALFRIPPDESAAPDGSIRFALDPASMRLIASGEPGKLEQVAQLFDAAEAEPDARPPAGQTGVEPNREAPPVIVAPGPGGIMIASEDIEALDDLESLLHNLAGAAMAGAGDLSVFYLVHAKAAAVAETLGQIVTGGSLLQTSAPGRAAQPEGPGGAAFGEAGALADSLLGLAGGAFASSGSVKIIPDARLNALIVRASPADTDTIRQLLEILDQRESPEEILAQPKPRLIPVHNTSAGEIAEVVRQVYQERLASASSGGRGPSPQEFVAALRGGGARGRASSRSSVEDIEKMSIGVDARANALVVSAPETLFQEVRQLVEDLDAAAIGSSSETIRVVALKRSNPETVQKALQALVGESVQSEGSGRRTAASGSAGPGAPSAGSTPGEEMQRAMLMRAIQQRAGGGGPPGMGGAGPGRGGPRGGGFPGGGGPMRGGGRR